jgi:hypothetical protein
MTEPLPNPTYGVILEPPNILSSLSSHTDWFAETVGNPKMTEHILDIDVIRRALKNYIKDMVAHRVSQKDLNVALELDEIINNANDTNFPILRVEFLDR